MKNQNHLECSKALTQTFKMPCLLVFLTNTNKRHMVASGHLHTCKLDQAGGSVGGASRGNILSIMKTNISPLNLENYSDLGHFIFAFWGGGLKGKK